MPRLKPQSEISQDEIKKALERPGSFALFDHPHRDDMFETWSLGPIIQHRDADLLTQSNAEALRKHLASDPSLKSDYYWTRCDHWAVGWVEHLSFRVLDGHGQPSRIFRVIKDWNSALARYPVADKADLQQRQHEDTLEILWICGCTWVDKEKAPKDWNAKVFSWLQDQGEEFALDDDGCDAPDEAQIKRGLKALGWLLPKHDDLEEEEEDGAEDSQG